MARRKNGALTKQEVIQESSKQFLNNGYTTTTIAAICKALDISPGNLTFHFHTKEHLLAVLVDILCDFQWKMIEKNTNDDYSPIMAVCLELASMASACEQDAVIKDFFISSYTSPMCLDIIRKNDAERAMKLFRAYRPDWTREQFIEAEILCSGIEYATLMTAGHPATLESRVAGALESILGIYGIPEEIRKSKIQRVFSLEYQKLGLQVLREFRIYVEQSNDHLGHYLQKYESM